MDIKDKKIALQYYDLRDAVAAPVDFEPNDGISMTVQSDWIPIGEQVRMIMNGEITIGNMDEGFSDEFLDLETDAPDEVFEDATDIGTEYSDELRDAVLAASEQNKANVSGEPNTKNENSDAGAPSEASAEEVE